MRVLRRLRKRGRGVLKFMLWVVSLASTHSSEGDRCGPVHWLAFAWDPRAASLVFLIS